MLPDEVELEHHYKFEVKPDWSDYRQAIQAAGVYVPSMFYSSSDEPLVEQLNRWYSMICAGGYKPEEKRVIAEVEKKLSVYKEYEFDFTKNLDWKVGRFGDKGSCFWGGRKNHRLSLQAYGCRAVRFYKGKKGAARAWAWPYGKHGLLLFNAYGYQLEKIGSILAKFFGLAHKRVYVSKRLIHVNNGDAEYIATKSLVAKTDEVELNVQQTYECIECHQRLPVSRLKDWHKSAAICKKCYGLSFRCLQCFTNLETAEIREARYDRSKYQQCPRCHERNYVCYYCEKPDNLNWYANNTYTHYRCRHGPK